MKRQYLGDARDAFKWDLLHWLCGADEAVFSRLVYVPYLTPDDGGPDGGKPAAQFGCRTETLRDFLAPLRAARSLAEVRRLGELEVGGRFSALLFAAGRYVPRTRAARSGYLDGIETLLDTPALVFLDPDNGFETRRCYGPKWALHSEVEHLLASASDGSAVVVYQHRPRRRWNDFFTELADRIAHAPVAFALHTHDLAFVVLTRAEALREPLGRALRAYAAAPGGKVELRTIEPRADATSARLRPPLSPA